MRVFVLPHTLIGLYMVWMIIRTVALPLSGEEVLARVTRVWSEPGGKGGTRYKASLQFDDHGVVRTDTTSITEPRFRELQRAFAAASGPERAEGPDVPPESDWQPAAVRYIRLGPLTRAELTDGSHRDDFGGLVCLVPWAMFWNTAVAVFWHQLYVVPARQRRLVRRGRPARGRVTDKTVKGRSTYRVAYVFETEAGRAAAGAFEVSPAVWNGAKPGDEVTVLHYAGRDSPSLVYEYCEYTAVG